MNGGPAEDLKIGNEVKRLFDRLMEESDPKLEHEQKIANVTAELDERVGEDWREFADPHGIELVPVVEGGRSEKPKKDEKKSLFDTLRKVMLEEKMEVSNLVDLTDLDKPDIEKPVKPERKDAPLHQMIEIRIKSGGC